MDGIEGAMLILKGSLLSVTLFVIVLVVSYYAIVPRSVSPGQVEFPVDFLRKTGMLTLGFGIGMLLIGVGLLLLYQLANAHLHSALRNMK
jgi:hypothetical protein